MGRVIACFLTVMLAFTSLLLTDAGQHSNGFSIIGVVLGVVTGAADGFTVWGADGGRVVRRCLLSGPHETRVLEVVGRGNVPGSGVGAVALNVTAVLPSTASFLTVFPQGVSRPLASNLNFSVGQTVPNMVIVPRRRQRARSPSTTTPAAVDVDRRVLG